MTRSNARIECLAGGLSKSSDRLYTGMQKPGVMAFGESKGVSIQDLRASVKPLRLASCGGAFSQKAGVLNLNKTKLCPMANTRQHDMGAVE